MQCGNSARYRGHASFLRGTAAGSPVWAVAKGFPAAGGGFGLRSLFRQDFFCRIREIFCTFFRVEQKTSPFCILQAETGPEICLFIPLWAAKVGGGWAFGRRGWRKGVRRAF